MNRPRTAAPAPRRRPPPVPGEVVHHRSIHGYRRAYRLAGAGPALLLLPGIGDSSEAWRPLIPELADEQTRLRGAAATSRPPSPDQAPWRARGRNR